MDLLGIVWRLDVAQEASGAFQKRTIVERPRGRMTRGGAIEVLGIPEFQREQNSIVCSLACTYMFLFVLLILCQCLGLVTD